MARCTTLSLDNYLQETAKGCSYPGSPRTSYTEGVVKTQRQDNFGSMWTAFGLSRFRAYGSEQGHKGVKRFHTRENEAKRQHAIDSMLDATGFWRLMASASGTADIPTEFSGRRQ